MAVAFDLYPHKCKVCGKKFESCHDWAYRELKKGVGGGKYWYFCSWHCIQEYREKNKKREVNQE